MQDNTTNSQFPWIGLSQGDFNGISYEIILKAFSDARMFETFTPVLYGQSKAFSYYKKNFGMETPNYALIRDVRQAAEKKFNIINIVENELKIEPGMPSSLSAEMSVLSMKRAADDLRNGFLDALVMAPDSPLVAQSNRDFLLSFHKEADPLQVLVNGQMRIALATGDMPLRTALDQIDIRYLVSKLTTLSQALKTDFGISSPKIAVMGINPHSGSIPSGDDEKVVKAIDDAQHKGLFAFGPFSASQLFASGWWKKYDAVMALHYEQGVFPLKFLSLDGYAYYWAGLPVVCAAPLHGPAYDIANMNKAVPDSYRKAIFLAVDVVNHRKEQ
jgi:4-hydroxythreonine-4-phosphate dehydrogenase